MREYKIKGKRGIDDLQNIYGFIGNSQGDTNASNSIKDYNNSGGWMSFVFDCALDQKTINFESDRRFRQNKLYIETLKKEGKYGEEYETSISIEHNPIFDALQKDTPLSSYTTTFLDFNK